MKYFSFFLVLFVFACNKTETNTQSLFSVKKSADVSLKSGDIIFQTSNSSQCKAVQLATHSPYSHCGIIYAKNKQLFVYEAVQPVKITPLDDWIAHGQGGHYVVKRLKDRDKILTPLVLNKMEEIAMSFLGKNYDLFFEWNDDRIYCSELVWKIYKEGAGIEVGKLQKLGSFDFSSPIVKAKLTERYGENIPLQELVIPPSGIFDAENLEILVQK